MKFVLCWNVIYTCNTFQIVNIYKIATINVSWCQNRFVSTHKNLEYFSHLWDKFQCVMLFFTVFYFPIYIFSFLFGSLKVAMRLCWVCKIYWKDLELLLHLATGMFIKLLDPAWQIGPWQFVVLLQRWNGLISIISKNYYKEN